MNEQKDRDEKTGRFLPGNPGKPMGSRSHFKQLEEALEREAKQQGKNFYEKLAEWCFRRPSVAIAILKKFIPDKTHAEIEIPEDPESAMAKARESLKKKLNDISKRLGDIDHIRPKESNEKSIKEK